MNGTTIAVGTYVREPDGANLLMFSDRFWNDPTTGLRERRGEWIRAEYDLAQYGFLPHPEARHLTPGEWIAYDGTVMHVGG